MSLKCRSFGGLGVKRYVSLEGKSYGEVGVEFCE